MPPLHPIATSSAEPRQPDRGAPGLLSPGSDDQSTPAFAGRAATQQPLEPKPIPSPTRLGSSPGPAKHDPAVRPTISPTPWIILDRQHWDEQAALHAATIGTIPGKSLERRQHGRKHPVWDFLFTYYNFPVSKLLAWTPGMVDDHGSLRPISRLPPNPGEAQTGWRIPPLRPHIASLASHIAALCELMTQRPPRFHCYGLHEWAMVLGLAPDQVRHSQCPLRLDPAKITRLLQSQSLQCTHFDAFRFFTPQASSLNSCQPSALTRLQLEQTGCIHANMDLYKWSSRLYPWIGSSLVGEAFALASQAREIDMRASPYDLTDYGFDPIRIETAAGREQYQQEQRAIAQRAVPIRQRLLTAARTLANVEFTLTADCT